MNHSQNFGGKGNIPVTHFSQNDRSTHQQAAGG